MINIDQGVVTAEVTRLVQADLIRAAEAGDLQHMSVLLKIAELTSNSTDTAKAETVTPLTKEGKQGGDSKQVSMTVKKTRPKARPKVKPIHHKGVRLTLGQFTVFSAVRELLEARDRFRSQGAGAGFADISGEYVAKFMGGDMTKHQVNGYMKTLKGKELLDWDATKRKGKRYVRGEMKAIEFKVKGDLRLGSKA
jgi:hypothetical protein